MKLAEDSEILSIIKNVLMDESEGIKRFIECIDERIEYFVKICAECEGKVVVTGMGKSGHIAKKISATMASLGTSSMYLHPAEAAHGDLGMVQKKDVVIMISKSGETEELLQLLNSLKVIGCRLLGIFCQDNSTLSQYCDLSITIPIEKEACLNNLAPTTSTTVTMALGDALAISLSKIGNFGSKDFAVYHPSGTLGKQLLMTSGRLSQKRKEEISVKKEAIVKDILWIITKNHLGAVSVVEEEGCLIGLVTDGDIRRALEKRENILQCAVSEIMTTSPISVKDTMLAVDTFCIMQEKKISVVPIINNDNKLMGMISIYDIVEAGIAR